MVKTRNSSRDRDRKERFEKFCGAIIHDNDVGWLVVLGLTAL